MAKFTSETARIAGQKSKRGKAKLEPILQDAIEVLFTGCRQISGHKKPSD